MNTKIIGLFMLVLLFATPALAAITVAITSPTDNLTYNNYPMNAQDVNITFNVIDANGAEIQDHILDILLYDDTWTYKQTIVDDANVRDLISSGDNNCFLVSATSELSDYECSVRWNMPENAAMPDGVYHVDINVYAVFDQGATLGTLYDANHPMTVNINTKMGNIPAIQSMLLLISTIVVVGIIIIGLLSITMLNADPVKTAMGVIAATIAVAIVAMVLGTIVTMM